MEAHKTKSQVHDLLCTDAVLCSCESVIWNTPTYSLSPSVGEVLPKQ